LFQASTMSASDSGVTPIGLLHLLQGRAEGLHQLVRQVGDEAHGVGQDRRAAVGQADGPQGRVQGGEQHVLGQRIGPGQPVEQGRLAGVGVAHQGERRVRRLLARGPMQPPGAAHLHQLALQLDDAVGDLAPVELDLGLAGAAGPARAPALALQVGPGPHQPRTLVLEPGQLDLQLAFARAGAAGEDLQDQARAVDDLALPGPLQIALLDGRQRVVHHHHVGVQRIGQIAEFSHLARPEQCRGHELAQGRDLAADDLEVKRFGEAGRLLQPSFRIAQRMRSAADGMDDEGFFDLREAIDPGPAFVGGSFGHITVVGTGTGQSSGSESVDGSYSWTGWAGIMVEMACL
jgi:hypothetical protein